MSDGNGALPEGWAKTTLGEVSAFKNGINFNKNQKGESGVPTVDVKNMYGDELEVRLDDLYRVSIDLKEGYELQRGDIMFVRSSVKREGVGRACLFDGADEPTTFCGFIIRARLEGEEVDARYVAHWVRTPQVRNWLVGESNQVTITNIGQKQLNSLSLPLAPLAEQRRIVSKIESLQERSSRARRALSEVGPLLEQFRQSVLRAAFSGRLTADWRVQRSMGIPARPSNNEDSDKNVQATYEPATELLSRIRTERRHRWEQSELAKYEAKGKKPPKNWQDKYKEPAAVSESLLPDLPQGWCWASVEQLSEIVEYGSSAKTTEDETAIPVLRMGNIFNGELRFHDLRYLPTDHDEFPRLLLRDGDVLFNRTNSAELVGKTAVFTGQPERCSFASYLIRLRIIFANPHLIAMYINSPFGREWANSQVSQQVGQANINGTKLKALAIPLAPVDEQTEIHRLVEESLSGAKGVEEIRAESESSLTQLDQSILAKAFRGELVAQDPRDEPASELLARIRTTRESTSNSKKKTSNKKRTRIKSK